MQQLWKLQKPKREGFHWDTLDRSKRFIIVVKEKQCKAVYIVLITQFIQYCRCMFAVSCLLLACHFHSCPVTLLSSQKHFSFLWCFFSPLVFPLTVLFQFLLCFACFYRNFQFTGGFLLRCSAFDHSEFLGLVNWMLKNKVVKRSGIFLKLFVCLFVCFKFPWHKWSIKLK